MRKYWSTMFEVIPDIVMEQVDLAVNGNQVWTEWHWYGTRKEGLLYSVRGVSIFTVESDEIKTGSLYMEPVEETGLDIDATIEQITKG